MGLLNLYRKAAILGWFPDADAVNAPDGALLRADNITLDEIGALALRKGSTLLYSAMGDLDVHSISTLSLTGFVAAAEGDYRLIGVSNRLFQDGEDSGVTFDGTGDFAYGTDSYQGFVARGVTKKKFDGVTLNNWAIPGPSVAPTLSTTNATSSTVASFSSAESPAFVLNEGTTTGFVTGADGVASGAIEMVPTSTGRFSLTKTFASDNDFLNIGGSIGTDTDLFDMFIWLSMPTVVRRVTVMFGMGTGSDPFIQDYYSFTFDIQKGGAATDVKNQKTYSASAYGKYVSQIQSVLSPEDITNVSTPEQVRSVIDRLNGLVGAVSKIRNDAQAASPAWAHLSVTRGQFDRVGGTAGRDWTTIRGFKVVYECLPGSADVVRLDSAVMFGGGDRALTGTYRCGFRFVRNTGAYQELSPLSPLSTDIVLTQQALQVTIPGTAISGADPQVNEIWVYLGPGKAGGAFLDTFYRFAVTGSTANTSSMRIDEFARTADGSIDAADRTRFVNQGLSIPGFTPNSDIVISIFKSEVDVLIENESIEPGCIVPPDNIVAIEGPVASRMFALTEEGWLYISGIRRPSTFSAYWALDLRQWGTPYWMKKTVGGVYVGMSSDVILIQGTGGESADHIRIDFTPVPQHIANPPVDPSVFTDQNTIIYRAADGLMTMTGGTASPVSQGVISSLWRGKTRHGVLPLNITTGRFRMAVDNHILYMLAPEGDDAESTSTIYRFYNQRWERTTYSANFRCIHREPNGDLVAGDTEGNLWLLEDGAQDDGADIPVVIWTPIDDGGFPLNRKDPSDMQLHVDTGNLPLSVDVCIEGSDMPDATLTATTSMPDVYSFNIQGVLSVFRRAQLRMTGSFNRFVFQASNISFLKRPQMVMSIDTGAVLPAGSSRTAWIRQVEVDCYSPANLVIETYINDRLKDTQTITVIPDERNNYRVTLPRNIGGARPRFKVHTTTADGAGQIGFEPYSLRVRFASTGNQSAKAFTSVWAAGEQLE